MGAHGAPHLTWVPAGALPRELVLDGACEGPCVFGESLFVT